jgi:ketosteroid isomerase-like protein
MKALRYVGLIAFACAGILPVAVAPAAPRLGGSTRARQARAGDVESSLRHLLEEQQAAWNRGDIDAFMQGYWHSAETTFSGTSGVTRGWDAVLARYHRNYPDRAAMGHLEFSGLEIIPLCEDAALILGNWHLDRGTPVGGVFTLVAKRFPEGWRIIHDHTDSVASSPR